jgi:hypothetical protein
VHGSAALSRAPETNESRQVPCVTISTVVSFAWFC